MKIKNIKSITIVLMIIFAFTSCEKEELAVVEPQATLNQDILTFATQEDFDKTLAKVNAMTKDQRMTWEKEQGFKSFGTICDEFYETIQPESFKSDDEVKTFVAKNSDKIELVVSNDGNVFCEPRKFNDIYRYLINKDEIFIIGNKAFKRIEDTFVSSSLSKIEDLIKINKKTHLSLQNERLSMSNVSGLIENNAYKENTIKIGSDNYLIKLYLRTTSRRDVADTRNDSPNLSRYYAYRRTEYRVINYARWLAIWWIKRYDSSITGSVKTKDDYNVTQSVSTISLRGDCDDSEYRQICDDYYTYIDPNNNSTSYFVSYNIVAKNITKNLEVNLVK